MDTPRLTLVLLAASWLAESLDGGEVAALRAEDATVLLDLLAPWVEALGGAPPTGDDFEVKL